MNYMYTKGNFSLEFPRKIAQNLTLISKKCSYLTLKVSVLQNTI